MTEKTNTKMDIMSIDWKTIDTNYRREPVSLDKVKVLFRKVSKENQRIRLEIIIGNNIAEKLNWKIKDKIIVMHNPDNIYHLLLVKGSNGKNLQVVNKYAMKLYVSWNLSKESVEGSKEVLFDVVGEKLVVQIDKHL